LGGRGGRNQGVDLFQNIIEEEEDEDGLDVSDDRDPGEHEGGVPSADNQNDGAGNPDESVAQDKTQVIQNRTLPVISTNTGFQNNLGKRKQKQRAKRPDPTKDNTTRGKIR